MFKKQTIRDIDLQGKTVLLRADYNVPVKDGRITDDYRITQSLPTVRYILEQDAKLIICSHLGRPAGPNDAAASLQPVAVRLQELLGHDVRFAKDCIGWEAVKGARSLETGQVMLLENLRYHKEEEQNDAEFAKQLASLAEVFVADGFGVVHRAHASTDAVTKYLPSVAGFLLEREVDTITAVMQKPKHPLAAIVGGAKISDKIDILHRFIEIADFVAVGGAMANTFLKARGIDVAASLYDKDEVGVAKDILEKAAAEAGKRKFTFYIPQDAVVATKLDRQARTRIVDFSAHVIADIENYPKRAPSSSAHIAAHEMILDVGPFSGAFIAGALQQAETVVWNGAMGVTEVNGLQGPVGPFAHGTDLVMEAMLGQFSGNARNRPFSLVGGGDTVGYIQSRGLVEAFNHVSTGGGASLELMAGRKLPGVEALLDKTGNKEYNAKELALA
ncbi:MAG TPA: phosphoglycerate kinase [Candidatus Saccharimonadales bacterium]|nr:phosphoglycerate kinase [Candidatus Saccharimonadales bacterium]